MRLRFEMRFSGPPNWKLRKEATDMSIYTMFSSIMAGKKELDGWESSSS